MSFHLLIHINEPYVSFIYLLTMRLFYGVKTEGAEVILQDFFTVLSKFQSVQPSHVFRLFENQRSYRTERPNHYYISKE